MIRVLLTILFTISLFTTEASSSESHTALEPLPKHATEYSNNNDKETGKSGKRSGSKITPPEKKQDFSSREECKRMSKPEYCKQAIIPNEGMPLPAPKVHSDNKGID